MKPHLCLGLIKVVVTIESRSHDNKGYVTLVTIPAQIVKLTRKCLNKVKLYLLLILFIM